MKKLLLTFSALITLTSCSYFDNVWSCIKYADTHGNGVTDYLEFREYDFTNGILSIFSASNLEMFSGTMDEKNLVSEPYSAFLESDLEDIFDDPFTYGQLNKIEEDSLYIKYEVNDQFGGRRIGMNPIVKNQPNSEKGSMYESFECKKTRVSDFFIDSHFPDQWNFEL